MEVRQAHGKDDGMSYRPYKCEACNHVTQHPSVLRSIPRCPKCSGPMENMQIAAAFGGHGKQDYDQYLLSQRRGPINEGNTD